MDDDWLIALILAGILSVGVVIGATVMYHSKVPEAPPVAIPDKNKMVERFDKLEERITQMAAARCMTVNTPILNVTVYDVPNLGKVKVPSPGVKVENETKPSN